MSELLVGQLVQVTVVISTDPAGLNPVDDPTEAFLVYKPDGLGGMVPVSPTPPTVKVGAVGTGTYSAQVTFDTPGWWEFVSNSTSTGAGKGRAKVYVSPVP